MNKQAYKFEQDKRGLNLSQGNSRLNNFYGSFTKMIPKYVFNQRGDELEKNET